MSIFVKCSDMKLSEIFKHVEEGDRFYVASPPGILTISTADSIIRHYQNDKLLRASSLCEYIMNQNFTDREIVAFQTQTLENILKGDIELFHKICTCISYHTGVINEKANSIPYSQ